MLCQNLIKGPQRHLAAISAGGDYSNLLTIAVLARLLLNLETTLTCIHRGLHLWLQSFYKVCKKRIVILLNKNHSEEEEEHRVT